jgi:hypothetical protein
MERIFVFYLRAFTRQPQRYGLRTYENYKRVVRCAGLALKPFSGRFFFVGGYAPHENTLQTRAFRRNRGPKRISIDLNG